MPLPMLEILFVAAILAIALGLVSYARRGRAQRQRRLAASRLSAKQRRFLLRAVPLYARLPAALRPRLEGRMHVFLDAKEFIGCRGLEVTDEMRLLIAAQACLLTLQREEACFPGFRTILLHPDTYVAEEVRHDEEIEILEEHVRTGESWHRGPVVLSWADVLADTRDGTDGRNVVLHEFAHKLDEAHDAGEGLPALGEPAQYASWAAVFSREYEALCAAADRGRDTLIDPYGAESPAEFFAVVTEAFFEQSADLERAHPALYGELAKFYAVDPARWPVR